MFIDTEEFLLAYLATAAPNLSVEMPNDPPMPFVTVARITGGDDKLTETAIVDVNVFHTSRDLASAQARLVHQQMMLLTPKLWVTTSAGVVRIDHNETIQGPSWIPYADENVRRYVMRYQISSRITATTGGF